MYYVSIIIPIFNAEDFLEDTIKCIINQSIGFHNIELILVDDCSTDNSKTIIKSYSDKYDNIKPVFLEKNSGNPAYPRNEGIRKATADYMIFLDSDDEIFSDYCEVLYTTIVNSDADIVNCSHSSKLNGKVYISKNITAINLDKLEIKNHEKLLLKHTAWGNIYSSSLIKENHIQFPSTLHEDGVFSLTCLLKTTKPVIRLPNYPGYIYLIENENSTSHEINLDKLKKFIEGYKLFDDLLKENNCEIVEEQLLSSCINMVIFILIKLDDLDNGIKLVYEFEKSLDVKITLWSKPLNIVNNKIQNKQFLQAKILIKLMGALYNNRKIRNFIFVNYSNLKILE